MRSLGAVLLLLITSFFAMTAPSLAQSNLRTCGGVDLTAPADGAELDPGYRINFTWDSEPRGTASREWLSVRVDAVDAKSFTFDDAKKVKAEARSYKGFARGRPGIYAWAVIFYDAKGNPICQSEARTYVVAGAGFASLSETSSAAIKAALGRYVVRLTGFSAGDIAYNGPVNEDVAGFIYVDGFSNTVDWQAKGYEGLDVHGTKKSDIIVGSNKGDRLFGHEGNDIILGQDGNDEIAGGNENCFALFGCHSGDFLLGEGGNDTITGGDESCLAFFGCSSGDVILGGDGDDTIHGGNENCFAFGGCDAGDSVFGGNGNDTINGNIGDDYVEGNDGDDTINGGDNWDTLHGNGGNDVIHGNDGNDVIFGEAGQDQLFGDNDDDYLNGGTGSDTLNGGPGIDTGTGGPQADTCSAGVFASCP